VLGRPDLAEDPRYGTNASRCEHRAELDAVLAGWAAGRSLADCRAAAEAAALGHARLNRPTEVLEHPQLTQRDRWQEIGSPAGPVLGLLPPPVVPGWDWRLDPIPALGEHTVPVLRELGFGADEVAAMLAAGAAGPS
jgi:itaconate CoA-transferase